MAEMEGRLVASGLVAEVVALSWPLISWVSYQTYGRAGGELFSAWGVYIILAPSLAAMLLIFAGLVRRGTMKQLWANVFMISSLLLGLYGALVLASLNVGVGYPITVLGLCFVVLNPLSLVSSFLGSWSWLNKTAGST